MVLTCRSFLLALFLAVIPTVGASTTWYVDGVNGNDGNNCLSPTTACKTIGHAISLASSGDSIKVGGATYTENLTLGFSLKVTGAGAATTIIDGGAVNTVVTVSSATANVVLSKLTIRNGKVVGGSGGGINNIGTLTIRNSAISGNSAMGGGFFGDGGDGGGIFNGGTLTVGDSTITGNYVSPSIRIVFGGGVYNGGTLTINNSTISGNSANALLSGFAGAGGGGIYNAGTLTINNSTVNSNSAVSTISVGGGQPADGGGIYAIDGGTVINNSTIYGNGAFGGAFGDGGGIWTYGGTLTINNSTLSGNYSPLGFTGGIAGAATLQNTIVADSSVGSNCSGPVTSNGYNLSSDNTCNFSNTGDLNNTDPMLGPLQNNGGPTQTQALLPGSPAIDAGNPSGCTDGSHLLKTDQRGKPRPDKEDTGGCDMGAFERQTD